MDFDKMIQATRIALLLTAFTAASMAWSLAGAEQTGWAGLMLVATVISVAAAFKGA